MNEDNHQHNDFPEGFCPWCVIKMYPQAAQPEEAWEMYYNEHKYLAPEKLATDTDAGNVVYVQDVGKMILDLLAINVLFAWYDVDPIKHKQPYWTLTEWNGMSDQINMWIQVINTVMR